MCVDDNVCYRRYLEHILGDKFELKFADSGEECIQRYNEELVDLVLLDTALPCIAATELCELLKDDPVMESVPVIFISELDSQSERECAYKSGGDDYITKAVSPSELKLIVTTALDFAA